MRHTPLRNVRHFAAEHLTWLSFCGLVAIISGFTPEEWVAHLAEELRVSDVVQGHWPTYLDIRAVFVAVGVAVIVTDVLLKRHSPRPNLGATDTGVAPELWVVQECALEHLRNTSDFGGMHDPAWRVGKRVRINLVYLGKDPLHALCAEHRSVGEAESHEVRLGEHHRIGSVTSISTVRQDETCILWIFPKSATSIILLRWVTTDGMPRVAELKLSMGNGEPTVVPTRLVGKGAPQSEAN